MTLTAEQPVETATRKQREDKRVPFGARNDKGRLLDRIIGAHAPAGFDAKLHKALKPSDFNSKAEYWEYQAGVYETKATEARKSAEDERNGGVMKQTKAKQKRMLSLKDKFDSLRAELEAAGIDVAAVLSVKA